MKIVLVDDNGSLQKVYAEGLQLRGFEVSVAGDYGNAMMLIQRTKPDIVLLDLLMPGVNGMDVLRALKADEQTKDIPVIVLTNINDAYFEHQTRELGVKGYYIKADITIDRLAEEIKSTVTKAQSE